MEPRISIITLGASDLAKSTKFYTDLGFIPQPGDTEISFFELQGTWLALFPNDKLAEDAKVSPTGNGFKGFTLAHNVKSKEEVDQIMLVAQRIGAKITDPAHGRSWGGYSGYFADPDNNLWEIAWNPYFKLDERS